MCAGGDYRRGGAEKIIAIGRWDARPGGKSAEVTFVVDSSVQTRGVGTALFEQLATTAIHFGERQFIARVLAENTAMIEFFDDSGFKITKRVDAWR